MYDIDQMNTEELFKKIVLKRMKFATLDSNECQVE